MSSSASSSNIPSWTISFVLGATSAISALWLHQKVIGGASSSSNSTSKYSSSRSVVTKSKSINSNNNNNKSSKNDPEEETTLMDAADLDHRMLRKAEAVLQWRTSRLVLVIERCTNDHNYSAILRTAEALGIQTVYMIDPPLVRDVETDADLQRTATPQELEARKQHHLFARNATEWLTVHDFETTEQCIEELRKEGFALWVTDLSQEAECLTMTTPAIPDKVALVMGTEAVGCSQYMLEQADKRVYLPLRGFADSLNLSVATALIIHQLFVMDPTMIGSMPEEERTTFRKAWYTKLCQQRMLTSKQKKEMAKLKLNLEKCQKIKARHAKQPHIALQATEQSKLDNETAFQEQLSALEDLMNPKRIEGAVQEWLDNPPQPLTDVRRADDHRVCYVGRKTKTQHQEHWKDMVATSNAKSIHGATAAAFREKLNMEVLPGNLKQKKKEEDK